MNIIGKKVTHKKWGEGTVVTVDEGRVVVSFTSEGEKKLIYPDAFEQHLVLEDPADQDAVLDELKKKKEMKLAEAVARAAEEEARKAAISAGGKTTDVDRGFGPDYHVEHLARQPILTYQQVEEEFGIKITGFGKGINNNGSDLVLISSVDKKKSGFVYHDHWDTNGDYIYSGEGKTGDQKMTGGNKAICDAATDGKKIHLFVKLSPEEYYYQGVFKLVDYKYEDEKDEDGNIRKEYKFRLRKVS